MVDPHETRRRRVELAATIVLAAAAVAIAWSTYQSTQWRGEQAADNSRASAARIESASASIRAGQLTQVDIATFTQWVDADVAGDTELADFYRERFRGEFTPAFEAWIATKPRTNSDAPATPFAMPEYHVAEADEADRLNAVADDRSAAASSANENSDTYMLAVVLFASSLFFAGMCTKLRSIRQQEILVVCAAVVFVVAAVLLTTFPAMFTA